MKKTALFFLVFLFALGLFADEAEGINGMVFTDGNHGWKLRRFNAGKEEIAELAFGDTGLELPLALPESREYVLKEPQKAKEFQGATALRFRLKLPVSIPKGTVLTVFSKDNDYLWRQIRVPVAVLGGDADGDCELRVPVAGADAAKAWECCGHSRPWNGLTLPNLLELGFRFELESGEKSACSESAFLLAIEPQTEEDALALKAVRGLTVNTLTPAVGTRLEVSFCVDGWLTAPFDSSKFAVTAVITLPGAADGKTETIRGFYFEDFLYDATDVEKTSCLRPSGEPCIKIRYCPRMAGHHAMNVTVRHGDKTLELPPIEFDAQAASADYHGFIQVDQKYTQHFCFTDGTVFNGLGMNVRSPFDDRYFHVAPYSTWHDQGLRAYETLFRKYRELGINVAEVWMCSWWLALEWIPNAPGFHGVGHYNQYRAWMLDRILQLAEENGIHLILVLNNHGKFGMTYDTEWAYNPYNVANGGYLKKCEDYFSDARAKADFKKTADYITARWGASPNLLAWKLFTEVDLTGQDIYAYQKDPNISAWHSEMGAYLKTVDIYQHPVTTHWMLSYGRIDHATASVKELDFLSTDAYYSLGGGSKSMMSLITGGAEFGRKYNKPLVITEFGGSSYGDSMRNLMNQVELALFTGFFHEMGIVPMCWWFALIEDKGLHGKYLGYHKFTAGEDRRGMAAATRKTGDGAVQAYELRGKDRLLFWVMDSAFYFTEQENVTPKLQKGLAILAPPLEAGEYVIEYWNLDEGKVVGTTKVTMPSDKIPLPEFAKTLGVKVIKSKN